MAESIRNSAPSSRLLFFFTCLPPPKGISLRHGAVDLLDAEGMKYDCVTCSEGESNGRDYGKLHGGWAYTRKIAISACSIGVI